MDYGTRVTVDWTLVRLVNQPYQTLRPFFRTKKLIIIIERVLSCFITRRTCSVLIKWLFKIEPSTEKVVLWSLGLMFGVHCVTGRNWGQVPSIEGRKERQLRDQWGSKKEEGSSWGGVREGQAETFWVAWKTYRSRAYTANVPSYQKDVHPHLCTILHIECTIKFQITSFSFVACTSNWHNMVFKRIIRCLKRLYLSLCMWL